jgi:hypothetical protein
MAARTRNVSVQEFDLGLDFRNNAMGARLAEGDYLVVQIPEDLQRIWDWRDWVYHRASGQVVKQTDNSQLLPYNYVVFGISRYEKG